MDIEASVRTIVDELADQVGLNSGWDHIERTAALDAVALVAINPNNTLTLTLYVDYTPTSIRPIELCELRKLLCEHIALQ